MKKKSIQLALLLLVLAAKSIEVLGQYNDYHSLRSRGKNINFNSRNFYSCILTVCRCVKETPRSVRARVCAQDNFLQTEQRDILWGIF